MEMVLAFLPFARGKTLGKRLRQGRLRAMAWRRRELTMEEKRMLRRGRGVVLSGMVALLVILPFTGRVQAAETGKLRIHSRPVESEIFIDGQHMGNGSFNGTLTVPKIPPGNHIVGIYNYGFEPRQYTVKIEAGKVTGLEVRLKPLGGTQAGPWGRIQIKGHPRAAVLLNGKTPEYVVGHVDEFDHEFGTLHEDLMVHPGTYQVTLVHGTQTIWSGTATVAANQKVVINSKTGQQKTEPWTPPAGEVPLFRAGLASARVAVAPVTGRFTVEPGSINCGDSSRLSWSSTGAVDAEVSGIGAVGVSGDQTVAPKQTTSYTFKASGPGGEASSTATVTVNNPIQASLEVAPQEIQYRRVGDKVVEQGSAKLSWSTSGGETVTLEPFGAVGASGSREVQPVPERSQPGPVDENVTYRLKVVNACGAEETRTASLHLTGSIAPAVTATAEDVGSALTSVFFPTDFPEENRPELGLLKSQQESIGKLAAVFKKFLENDPKAQLELEAHADVRGSVKHNQGLTDRRAARVKDYLVEQGVPTTAVATKAYGKKEELSLADVKQLEEKNPNPAPKGRARAKHANWLAYNRRVDISLGPAGLRSNRYYPHQAADSDVLWQVTRPRWRVLEKAR
jgi:outer membrane protein OmpA-like peptidoglycan-associated protein